MLLPLILSVISLASPLASLFEESPECGQTFIDPLIDDISIPHDSIPHSWPWLAEFCYQCETSSSPPTRHSGEFRSGTRGRLSRVRPSGGFIVGSRWILSTATDGFESSGYRIRVGLANRYEEKAVYLLFSLLSPLIFPPNSVQPQRRRPAEGQCHYLGRTTGLTVVPHAGVGPRTARARGISSSAI